MTTSPQGQAIIPVETSTNNQSDESQPAPPQPAPPQSSLSSKVLVSLTDKDSPEPTNVSSLTKEDDQSQVQNSLDTESMGSVSQPNGVMIENGGESSVHFVSSKEEVVHAEPEKQKQDGGYVGGVATPPIQEPQDGMKKKVPETLEVEEHIVNTSPTGRFVKYEQEIGRGSFKTVYKGLDTETGVAVAWCELLEHKFNKEEQSRFKEEVAILKTLNHPYILRLFDSWEFVRLSDKKRVLVLITELMTSGTLKSYMRRFKSIKPRVIRSWGRQILRGLSFLHTRTPPIIHRDLKCDNVFINGTTGLVKIGDLGLATLKRSDVKTVIGTPEFMAPEMYDEVYDESVDVYAFGMCVLEMCTLEYPYQECSNPAQIYKKVTSGVMPHSLNKVNDPMLKEIIVACTKLSKSARYTVEMLLNHEFFAEGDVKVEVMTEPTPAHSSMMVRLVVPRTSKENHKNEQESIEFAYNLQTDIPEDIVNDMVKSGILREEDKKNAIRSVRELTDPLTDPAKQKRQQKPSAIPHGNVTATGNGNISKETGEGHSHQILSTESTPLPQEIELSSNRSNFQRQLSSASDEMSAEPSGVRHTSERITASTQINNVGVGGAGGGVGSEGPSANSSPNIPHKITGGTAMTTPSENSEDSEKESIDEEPSFPKKYSDVTSAPVLSKSAPPSSKTTPNLSRGAGRGGEEERGEEHRSLNTKGQGDTVNRTYSEDGHQPDLLSGSVTNNAQINVNSVSDATPTGRDLARSASFYSSSQTQSETQTSITHSQTSFSGTTVSQSGTTQSSSSSTQSQTTSCSSISSGYHSQSSSTLPISSSSSSSASPSVEVESTQTNGSSSTTSGGGSFRSKKGSRTKDNKRIKLKFNEKVKDNVISCALQTSAGQVINFKFSLEYDKPHEIFNNLVKAGHLSQLEEGDFISQFQKVVDTVRSKSTGDSTSSDARKNQGTLRSTSVSYSSVVKQDSDQSKHSESYQKGGVRSDSPYDGSGQLGGVKRDGMVLSEVSPHSRRKFEVSDVFVEKPNEKASITSQVSAESMIAMSPVHSEDTCILPPSSSDTKPTQDTVHVFHSTTALPTCTLTTGDKGPGGDTPSSVATGNLYPPNNLSTTSSVISSASSSYSNLQPSGTVTPNIVTVEAPNKKFEIEDVIDPETLSTESSTENLVPDDRAESKDEVTPTESNTAIKDDELTSVELSTPPTFSDEDTLTYSRVKEMESSSKPHPPTTTNQPMYSPYSVQQVEPPPPLLLSPFSHVPPTHGTLLENPLVFDGFMKFMYYMKLLFEDPSITALLQQITINNNNSNTEAGQPPSNVQSGSTATGPNGYTSSNGHTAAGSNGHNAAGTNGHTAAGSNGHNAAGTNGHSAGSNGHTAGTNGHSAAGTNGHSSVNSVHVRPPVSHHSAGLLSSLANVSGVVASYATSNDQLQQSDEETDGERQQLLREINRIEEEEKRLKKDKERFQAHLRRGSAVSHESTNVMSKNSTATYPPHHITSTSSAILSSASLGPKDEREQQQQQNLQQQLHYQQQQQQQQQLQQLNYYSIGSTTGQIPGYPFHYYPGGPPLHPPSHDTRDGGSLLSQQQKNSSTSNLVAAGEPSRHMETGRGTPYFPSAPIGGHSHVLPQEGLHMMAPSGMWLPDWQQYMHPHVQPHYSSTNQPILQGLHHSITPHISHPPPSSHLPMQQSYKQPQQAQQEHQTYQQPQQEQILNPVGVQTGMTSPTRLEGAGDQDLTGASMTQKR